MVLTLCAENILWWWICGFLARRFRSPRAGVHGAGAGYACTHGLPLPKTSMKNLHVYPARYQKLLNVRCVLLFPVFQNADKRVNHAGLLAFWNCSRKKAFAHRCFAHAFIHQLLYPSRLLCARHFLQACWRCWPLVRGRLLS